MADEENPDEGINWWAVGGAILAGIGVAAGASYLLSEQEEREEREKEELLHQRLINGEYRDIIDSDEAELVEYEWDNPRGKGDLVFQSYDRIYHVIEVKWIDYERNSNSTVSRRNTQKRADVQEQARRYGREWKRVHPNDIVRYYAVINDRNDEFETLLREDA
ncbi:hypothetical protein HDV06_003731 [Boothiomyces sp. JEL0866]|nr:hypothetical protein HDV06_003731 [Boothiomyces sp. JEL0866]